MQITVRLFAGLRERYGMDVMTVSVPGNITVSEVWSLVLPEEPLPDNVLAAQNMEYVDYESAVADGDEIAFFPPVTGGAS
ncbi:molybdopterin synthase sulfur carrier subunit [Thiogranum longum]|uniref:Molybdopterin synthase sulfur carrier subunit n=1 Tax=Thiogranum longum TaxID=1537524 RepID=A0A4R1HG89_9GAMM|nr:MoaD/ThiS family protein [Thiogranum longum]TCK19425.1 molybdopterin synthase sulfur carrier subunit [Thiogranum longum]